MRLALMATGRTRSGSVTACAQKSMTPCRAGHSFFTSHPSLSSMKNVGRPGYKPKPQGGED
nr:MAG TPA: hypothetical protein [Caudoviricetes sp.]